MKPQMWLDSKLAKTRSAPIGPDGEVDWPRLNKLEDFRFLYAYDTNHGEPREEYRAAWEELRAGFEFRDIPLLIEHRFMFGANATAKAYSSAPDGRGFLLIGAEPTQPVMPPPEPAIIHGCHPETWAAMPEEFRAQYDAKTEEDMTADLDAPAAEDSRTEPI